MRQRRAGLILSYVNIALSTVLGLFISSFILRKLGASQYGLYQMMSSFANYLTLLQFGTGTVMTRNIAKSLAKNNDKDEIDRTISTVFTISVVLAVLLVLVSLCFYCSIEIIYSKSLSPGEIAYGKQLFLLLTSYLIFNFMTQTFNGIAFGFEAFSYVKTVGIVKLLIRTAIIVVIFQFYASSLSLVLVDVIVDLVVLIITVSYCLKKFSITIKFSYFSRSVFMESMPLAAALFLQTFVNQANSNVDKFVIGIALTPEHVAVYSVAMYIFSTYSSLSTIPISIYLPKVVRDVNKGLQGKELTDTLIAPSRLLVLIGGAILFGFITIGQQFIFILYGEQYIEAYIVCIVIMIPMFVNLSNGILINVLDALGKRMSRSIILMCTTVLNIVLTIWWIQERGIMGAAIATAVATTLGQIIIMNCYYSRKIGIPIVYMFLQIYKGIIPSFVIAMIVGILMSRLFESIVFQFFVGGIVFVAVMAVCMYLWGASANEKKAINTYVEKLLKKGRKR